MLAVMVQTTDGGDTASLPVTLDEATDQLSSMDLTAEEVVADKAYHANATRVDLKERGLRSYISEPNHRNWKRNKEAQKPTYANRRRIRGTRGKALLRQRGEPVRIGHHQRVAVRYLVAAEAIGLYRTDKVRQHRFRTRTTSCFGVLHEHQTGFFGQIGPQVAPNPSCLRSCTGRGGSSTCR